MIIIDNKKAHDLGGQGLIDVNNFRKVNMTTIQQNLLNPNNQPLVIGEFSIRQDEDGRYCLNDLHKASGDDKKHFPAYFLRNQQTKDLIEEIERYANSHIAVKIIKGGSEKQGTYVVKELVYSYAMWISAKFHLMVIRAYDSLVMEWMIGGKQTISPEQAGILYNIVHTRAGDNKNTIVQMWSRLKNHFKYSASYRELRAIHFEDAKHYLEVMDLKAKQTAPEKPAEQVKPLDGEIYELVRQLTEAIILENDEIIPILQAVKIIDVKRFAYLSHKVVRANERARDLSWMLNFRNKLDEPLIDKDCSVISLSTGQRFIARPNWFNCPA